MFTAKYLGIAALAGCLASVAVGPAEALVRQSWDPGMVAYSYVYYADAAKTQELG